MPKHSILLLPSGHLSNLLKGGDFMGVERVDPARQKAIKDAVRRMEWEGALLPGIVEVGSNPTTHPLRKGRIRIPTASEIAGV